MHLWPKCFVLSAVAVVFVAAFGTVSTVEAQSLCIGKESVLLRAGPSWRQDPVGSVAAGTCGVKVVGKCQSGWCEIAVGDRRGWVDSRLVNVQEKGAPEPRKSAPQADAPRKETPPPARQAAPAPPSPPPRSTASAPASERESHCVMGVRPGDTLRIRSGPSAEHREIGGIPPNACGVTVGAPCQGSWCPVTYRDLKGWSNATYLRPPWMR